MNTEIENSCINAIRFLAADAIEKAGSGHPGMPMGAAPLAFTLWVYHLKHNPADPLWPDRDRFVLSAGHASMLLYALLYLTGYDVTLEDIKQFRQWGSKTPGHPERCHPSGVELTTGPLGQGISHAVGMAMAEVHLASKFNTPEITIVDHYTYVLASDGDMMEGVTFESCALAGHLGLGKLIVLYDDNGISLAGSTALTFTEDIEARFRALGWQVLRVFDGTDCREISRAIEEAKNEKNRPSLIRVFTKIGYGAPKKGGTSKCHGAPLGLEELVSAKEQLGWPVDAFFYVPEDVLSYCRSVKDEGAKKQSEWEREFNRYCAIFPERGQEFLRVMRGDLPGGWEESLNKLSFPQRDLSTRKASESVLQILAEKIPELMGGSADLNPSCLTWLKNKGDFQRPGEHREPLDGEVGGGWNYSGRNVHFGVREHAMGAIAGGLAVHGGIRPYAATFLVFSDYMRPPMRLAAIMGLPVIYVFTHDSIAVGEDGPTHQPVEQLMNLRAIPNLRVIRPCDAAETVEAWKMAVMHRRGPTAIVLTRQDVPVLDRTELAPADGLRKGGYVLWESSSQMPDLLFIATGSEVALALDAARKLAREGVRVRLVSLPCWELFDEQPESYKYSVLPPMVKARIAVEAGVPLGWEHYVGLEGRIIGVNSFGASAPQKVLMGKFGFTVEHIVKVARSLIS
ncbi:MAG: transketolase [Syntrophales bacterium]|nr:transketolase [Syntrophales bacterium]